MMALPTGAVEWELKGGLHAVSFPTVAVLPERNEKDRHPKEI